MPYPGHTLSRGSAICGGSLLEKRQQVHFGVPAGDLNQPRMGGENAEYLAGAEQHPYTPASYHEYVELGYRR